MPLLQTLKLILTLLPLLLETVRAIEAALPDNGQGAAKLAMVRQVIEAAYSVATDAAQTFDVAWPTIEKTIAAAVTLFNAAGVFRK